MNYKELSYAFKNIISWYKKKTKVLNIKSRPYNTGFVFFDLISRLINDNKKVLSRELLIDYFESIQEKIMEYLGSLSDADLYEKPDGCAYNRLSLILGQFRHFHCHMGNINATTIYNTTQWPKVAGMYWLDKIEDCKDIKDLYE